MASTEFLILNRTNELSVLTTKPPTLAAALLLARKEFNLPEKAAVSFTVRYPTASGAALEVGLTASSWPVVVLDHKSSSEEDFLEVEVVVKDDQAVQEGKVVDQTQSRRLSTESEQTPPAPAQWPTLNPERRTQGLPNSSHPPSREPVEVSFRHETGYELKMLCRPDASTKEIQQAFLQKIGPCGDVFEFHVNGSQLHPDMCLISACRKAGVGSWNPLTIDVHQRLRGATLKIALFPKCPTRICLALKLRRHWRLDKVYPRVEVRATEQEEQHVKWEVTASPDGTLVDSSCGEILNHLSWDAHLIAIPSKSSVTINTSALNSVPVLTLIKPRLDETNGVLLPFNACISHLLRGLDSLFGNRAISRSFLQDWMPNFLAIRDRNQRILMRFLTQEEIQESSKLYMEPPADVITRVFMVFKGLDEKECGLKKWERAILFANMVDWREAAKIKLWAFEDNISRVLEWGGMEL